MNANLFITELSLKVGSDEYTCLLAGREDPAPVRVDELELELHSYGFRGAVEFTVEIPNDKPSEDPLAQAIGKPDLAWLTLALQLHNPDERLEPDADRELRLRGMVVSQAVKVTDSDSATHYIRHYRLRFEDAAAALWSQHSPCRLYTKTTMKDVFAREATEHVTLDCQAKALTANHSQIFVGLDARLGASFYDFAIWRAAHDRWHLVYDYDEHAKSRYRLVDDKVTLGKPAELDPLGDQTRTMGGNAVELRHATPAWWSGQVFNSFECGWKQVKPQTAKNAKAVTGLWRDHLMHTPIQNQVKQRAKQVEGDAAAPLPELHLNLAFVPTNAALIPGVAVKLPRPWRDAYALDDEVWRVYAVRLTARVADGQKIGLEQCAYNIDVDLALEHDTDERQRLPGFRQPHYPVRVEGTIVGRDGAGEDVTECTYFVDQDKSTSRQGYRVQVPVWDANAFVAVPYEPRYGGGAVFMPPYHGARVLLAMDLHDAHIDRFLDWRDDARDSSEAQGEQIVLGKSRDNRTFVRHHYDGDKPQLDITRVNGGDISRFTFREGGVKLTVEETKGQ